MATSDSTTQLKQCSKKDKCVNPLGCWLPATTEYFSRDKHLKSGLMASCKVCCSHRIKEKRKNKPEVFKEYNQRRYQKDPEKAREYSRRYRKEHPDEAYARVKRWRQEHPEKRAEEHRLYKARHPERITQKDQRRRARELALPATFTSKDWQRCLDYWDYRCAYCNRRFPQRDLFGGGLQQDHYVPLTMGGGYTSDNIVPACGQQGGCNQLKNNKLPSLWLSGNFGVSKARRIEKRINAYFDWIRRHEGGIFSCR